MTSLAMAAEPPSTVAPAAVAISDWRIVPERSRVAFSARHYLLWTLQGVSLQPRGIVRLNEADPRFTHVDVRIPVASLTTGRRWQDRQLLSPAFLDGEVHREIAFLGHWLRGAPRREFALDGELRLRGVAREITLNVKARDRRIDERSGTERATYHATTVLDRRDFWHTPPVAARAILGDTIRITLDLTLMRSLSQWEDASVPWLAPTRRRAAAGAAILLSVGDCRE
jgi:polyisoprenoid-binding protein YceI